MTKHLWSAPPAALRSVMGLGAGVALALGTHAAQGAAPAAPDAADPLDFYISEEYLHDDNLFRVPTDLSRVDPAQVDVESLPGRSEDDFINKVSAGLNLRTDASRQVLNLGLRFDDVRYQKNDDLNYHGGNAQLGWDWQLGSRLSGRLIGLYDRTQASFANYLLFDRDVVESTSYGLEVRYRVGSRFALLGGGARTSGDHSLALRRDQNFDGDTARAGVEYRTPSNNLFGVDFRNTRVEFGNIPNLPGIVGRDYEEDAPGVLVKYAFTVKTSLEARAGYLQRDYLDPAARDYSGESWSLALRWEPRLTIFFDIKAGHDLRAYSDAETDYFVADTFTIAPTWKPRDKLKLTTAFTWEQQDYIGNGLVSPLPGIDGLPTVSDPQRQDDVQSVKVSLDYTPRDMLGLGLMYQHIQRDSNRALREYDNSVVGFQLKLTF
jgi:exopolysaccharide biosynthesis operon protein EpsL